MSRSEKKLIEKMNNEIEERPSLLEILKEEELVVEIKKQEKIIRIANVGIIGSTTFGKSTLACKLAGDMTERTAGEVGKDIQTKQVGYEETKIYTDDNGRFITKGTDLDLYNQYESDSTKIPVHHISLIDCPGHSTFLSKMVGSVGLMQCAILVVSDFTDRFSRVLDAHIRLLKEAKIKKVIVCINKVDLYQNSYFFNYRFFGENKFPTTQPGNDYINSKFYMLFNKSDPGFKKADTNGGDIKYYDIIIKKLNDAKIPICGPIIPTSFVNNLGIDNVINSIVTHFQPEEDKSSGNLFLSNRDFCLNSQGTEISDLTGACIGGSVVKGRITIGDEINVRPGIKKDGKYYRLLGEVVSLRIDDRELTEVTSGGLVSIGTNLVPWLSHLGNLGSCVFSSKGSEMDPVFSGIVKINELENMDEDIEFIAGIKAGQEYWVQFKNKCLLVSIVKVENNKENRSVKVDLQDECICSKEGDTVIFVQTKDRENEMVLGKGILSKDEDGTKIEEDGVACYEDNILNEEQSNSNDSCGNDDDNKEENVTKIEEDGVASYKEQSNPTDFSSMSEEEILYQQKEMIKFQLERLKDNSIEYNDRNEEQIKNNIEILEESLKVANKNYTKTTSDNGNGNFISDSDSEEENVVENTASRNFISDSDNENEEAAETSASVNFISDSDNEDTKESDNDKINRLQEFAKEINSIHMQKEMIKFQLKELRNRSFYNENESKSISSDIETLEQTLRKINENIANLKTGNFEVHGDVEVIHTGYFDIDRKNLALAQFVDEELDLEIADL